MKRFVCGLLVGLLLGMSFLVMAAEQYTAIKVSFPVLVNGKALVTDKPVVTINGSTYLPLRVIGEVLSVPVNWNSQLSRVEIGNTPSTTLHANQIVQMMKYNGAPIKNVLVYLEGTDPNKIMGKPNQYTSRADFSDTSIEQPDNSFKGGIVEVFANNADAQRRKTYIDTLAGAMPFLAEYNYVNGYALLRLDKAITPERAEEYKAIFMGLAIK